MHVFIPFLSCFYMSVHFPVCPPALCYPPTLPNQFFLQLATAVTYPTVWLSPCQMLLLSDLHFSRLCECNDPTEVASLLKLELIIVFNIAIIWVFSWERVDWGKCFMGGEERSFLNKLE